MNFFSLEIISYALPVLAWTQESTFSTMEILKKLFMKLIKPSTSTGLGVLLAIGFRWCVDIVSQK